VKRPYGPGQHGQTIRRKPTVYAAQLLEKQKIRTHYGLLERQMRKTFSEAQRMGGVTGSNLLMLLESRLDCVMYRMGLGRSINQARQFIVHGHIFVNGKKVDKPSFMVKPGMEISVREESRKIPVLVEAAENPPAVIPQYLERGAGAFEGKMVGTPTVDAIPFKPDVAAVIGFYSR
jgi:small subunit ribosomal protein S4